jgi:hypothetical protein
MITVTEISGSEISHQANNIEKINRIKIEDVTVANDPRLLFTLQKCFSYVPKGMIFKVKGQIIGYLLYCSVGKRIVSIPHFSYASLIMLEGYEATITSRIIEKILESRSSYLIRRHLNGADHHFRGKSSHILILPNTPEIMFDGFKSKLRSQIKRGEANGVIIKCGGEELCSDFFDIYSNNMRYLGSPCLPIAFFKELLVAGKSGDRRIYVASIGGNVIGGAFVLEYLGFVEVCWASTLRDYNHLSPNMVLYWHIIKDCIQRGSQRFSFGRSTAGSGPDRFKSQWGTDRVVLDWSSDAPVNSPSEIAKFGSKIWRFLPLPVSILIGSRIARYIY